MRTISIALLWAWFAPAWAQIDIATLPTTKAWITLNNHTGKLDSKPKWQGTVYIADTEAQRQQGLMYVKNLPPDRGMVFVYRTEYPLHFWMKNTYVPLTIISFDRACQIVSIQHLKPLDERSVFIGDAIGAVEIPQQLWRTKLPQDPKRYGKVVFASGTGTPVCPQGTKSP